MSHENKSVGENTWTFKESSRFQKARSAYLTDVEFEALREVLPRHQEMWVSLTGAPALFGLHWGRAEPITIVFMVALDDRTVFLLEIEPGTHDSVSPGVKRDFSQVMKEVRGAGIRVFIYETAKGTLRWIVETAGEIGGWF